MGRISPLFTLVNTLSKAEKRYFRLFSSLQKGDKAFVGLFDIIAVDEQPVESVRNTFHEQFPAARYEVASKHLYKTLMRSLRSFDDGRTVEHTLTNLISEIRILFNKGIVPLCFREIERAKKIALKHEKYLLYVQIARIELQYLTTLEFPQVDETRLIRLQEKINDVLYLELFINKHSSLYEILTHRYVQQGMNRSDREREKLNDLLLEEFQVNANQHYNSFESDKLHLHFQSTYFMMTGNTEQGLHEFYQLHKLFEANRTRLEDDPVYYIYMLQGIITSLRVMDQYDDIPYFINKLRNIEATAKSQEVFIRHLVFQNELSIYVGQGNVDEALQYIQANGREISRPNTATPNVTATTQLQISIAYFGVRDFHRALQHVNKALSIGEPYISKQVYSLCRLLSLIIHVELNNDDHLGYAVRSVERRFNKEGAYRVEKITIRFVRLWIRRAANNRMPVLLEYQKQLLQLMEDKYESQFFKWFNLPGWVESKILKSHLRKLS